MEIADHRKNKDQTKLYLKGEGHGMAEKRPLVVVSWKNNGIEWNLPVPKLDFEKHSGLAPGVTLSRQIMESGKNSIIRVSPSTRFGGWHEGQGKEIFDFGQWISDTFQVVVNYPLEIRIKLQALG